MILKRAFSNVFCSQCGRSFGPGEHGFSSCDQHQVRLWSGRNTETKTMEDLNKLDDVGKICFALGYLDAYVKGNHSPAAGDERAKTVLETAFEAAKRLGVREALRR